MDFDAELIRALQEDGRASILSLAERVGQSRAVVAARLRALLSDRTVRVVAAVDPVFLGQHVLAHVSIRTDGAVEVVAEHLRDMSETVLVSAVGGAHDIVTEVRVGSMSELHDLLARIRGSAGVLDINTIIYSTVIKGFFVSEYHGGVTLDGIDEALIEHLQSDGRMSFRALGEQVRLSPSAVATRVQRLIDAGVIKISAVEARGLAHRQLSMGVGMTLGDDDEAVIDELRRGRGVDFAARTLGRFDAVATLVEPSAGALYASLERLRALPGVTRIEAWLHLAVLKEDYARTLRPLRTD
ncbi:MULTISPECIES: Lrp/AsnC family transcriptional regulator [Microbacterium]|jgi:DNA-binding Lrp family transcriptional regulator|uniref:DNA-binding transcriptional regulator, Lrp family n=1 Tax=Microbacterium paraoxydans TaxID=199592 RepID=A0A1H1S3Y1_9MICO|nr:MULTISPECIES: Lrp/AsnC family transcriptional regulator [Microbacterium]AVL98479.1 Lrp/AsnC family transcriptional regulator [Microbacterium sp. str. 'China']MCK2033079.1 Lrp/AsnC family transcriptional regulator [Microbacterium sp. KSW4-4]MCT2224839.1 Lrp/AsnC family transcriptional regulator [Microbacterium paraoxydans]SDS42664.1 DNA-binding transcriptional regulator, Lrp family [Microbacterium paraoxydans]